MGCQVKHLLSRVYYAVPVFTSSHQKMPPQFPHRNPLCESYFHTFPHLVAIRSALSTHTSPPITPSPISHIRKPGMSEWRIWRGWLNPIPLQKPPHQLIIRHRTPPNNHRQRRPLQLHRAVIPDLQKPPPKQTLRLLAAPPIPLHPHTIN